MPRRGSRRDPLQQDGPQSVRAPAGRGVTQAVQRLSDGTLPLAAVRGDLARLGLARAMLGALIAGESDPRVLAELAKGKMRRKIPALTEALTGHFDEQHAQLARSMLARISSVEAALAELNSVLAQAFLPWAHQLELLQDVGPVPLDGLDADHQEVRDLPGRAPLGDELDDLGLARREDAAG